jgi:hypothetical protein
MVFASVEQEIKEASSNQRKLTVEASEMMPKFSVYSILIADLTYLSESSPQCIEGVRSLEQKKT